MGTKVDRIELKPCAAVAFDPAAHTYADAATGEPLSGVTPLIHAATGLGYDPEEMPDFAREVAVPRAAEYGTAVHAAIATWESLGVEATIYDNTFDGGFWDVGRELAGYRRLRCGRVPLAAEWTVRHGGYASSIDNVWMEPDGTVALSDTKTNNPRRYPGGRQALVEWLSWQLSCYAMMLEEANPGLEVSRLYCCHLRHDDAELWDVRRKDPDAVRELLATPWTRDAGGRFSYEPTRRWWDMYAAPWEPMPGSVIIGPARGVQPF